MNSSEKKVIDVKDLGHYCLMLRYFLFSEHVVVLVLILDLKAAVVLKPSHKHKRNEETLKLKVSLKIENICFE